jgi:nucleoid DNA-binding protein
MKLVKRDLVHNIAKRAHVSLEESKIIFDKLILALESALARGERIEIRDLGTFRVRWVHGRKARNLLQGTSILLTPRRKVVFRAGKLWKSRELKSHEL